ncbi:2-keto-4-pentenoate hydratase [Pectobacterium actinidiae]|uniref:2-keto-4-pentenoate hydratase n=1 Tax=Pectobacterium actinidiae TaxID=1507808 RepID=UPI00404089BA
MTIEDAYKIQALNIARQMLSGAKRVGAKIGLTSEVVQKQMGVNQPDFGVLLNTMEYAENVPVPVTALIQPKVEAEIAFVLSRSLSGTETELSEIADAIEFALPAVEIVDSRICNWDISITDTIADNASAAAFITGRSQVALSEIDLVNCVMTMKRNGEIVSEGKGENCLSNPLVAVQWLSKIMAEQGNPLQQGDVILSGALGPMAEVSPGDVIDIIISGLGSVSVRFDHA